MLHQMTKSFSKGIFLYACVLDAVARDVPGGKRILINASGHPANFDDFQILSSSSDSYELMINESLLINKYKPNLNIQGSSVPLNLF